jgi:hypothetical protein
MKVKSVKIERSWSSDTLKGTVTLESMNDVTTSVELSAEVIIKVLDLIRKPAVDGFKAQVVEADRALGDAIAAPAIEAAAQIKELTAA